MKDIRTMTADERSKIKSVVDGKAVEFRLAVISDEKSDPAPVKGWVKGRKGWLTGIWGTDGNLGGCKSDGFIGTYDLFIESVPVKAPNVFLRINAPGEIYPTASSNSADYVRSVQHPKNPQAFIKIVDFSEVKLGDGLTPGTELEYKLVPVVK